MQHSERPRMGWLRERMPVNHRHLDQKAISESMSRSLTWVWCAAVCCAAFACSQQKEPTRREPVSMMQPGPPPPLPTPTGGSRSVMIDNPQPGDGGVVPIMDAMVYDAA